MNYGLPNTVEIAGVSYEIRADYRAVLDIFDALSDPELSGQQRAIVVLDIFYPAFAPDDETVMPMPEEHYQEAIEKCFWFIRCGEEEPKGGIPKLVSWEKDFPRIVAPINRIVGKDIRSLEFFHWWSFMAAYQEIGDCLFAQIVNIRNKKAKGKRLDKAEREFYRNNQDIIDIEQTYTKEEKDLLAQWTGQVS